MTKPTPASTWVQLDTDPITKISHVDINHRGLGYGDGFFSTMRVHQQQVQLLSYHLNRITQGATQLGLTVDIGHINQQLIGCAKKLNNGILKIIISRANPSHSRGYAPSTSVADVYLQQIPTDINHANLASKMVLPLQSAITTGLLAVQLGLTTPRLVGLKTLNRLEQVLAAQALQQTGWQEGLMATVQNKVVEGVSANFFYQLSSNTHTWYTPPIDHAGILGVMRQFILDSSSRYNKTSPMAKLTDGQPIQLRPLATAELSTISSLFFCNSVKGIVPVAQLMTKNQTVTLKTTPIVTLHDKLQQQFKP